ncbi:NACHT domain-containing protein [Streptomyces sp. Ncost-T10-10d]|nr:NACHT domain-containing protein [Streptomyces sp. Ncost-T10-10d]
MPAPDEFLRTTGVPLHGSAPAGWADRLLAEGRALVLVDGVDEVPMRLRNRTERWLKDLIAAYPQARYVVTTRPSAVPDGWLGQQGFVAHSLLPMERDDIRAFIGHWHDAARAECLSDDDRAQLDTYEGSLRRAVGMRRDLGRLATNPLMCALNRDRRMQLPRASTRRALWTSPRWPIWRTRPSHSGTTPWPPAPNSSRPSASSAAPKPPPPPTTPPPRR